MNKEQLRELVKAHFNLTDNIQSEEITTEKFDEATLVDGTKVSNQLSDAFAEGQILYVITEESETIIAPEGAHVTESGIEIVVDGQGVITQVNHPDEEEAAEEVAEEAMSEEVEETIEEKVELAEHPEEEEMEESDAKEAIVEAIAEIVMPKLAAMEEKMADMEEKMKEYMSKPAATPSLQSKFEKINSIKTKETSKSGFNAREAQLKSVLEQFKKKTK